MLIYIIKSVACMAIFFVFYKLLLEKENMHVFKRFYLLLAMVASLLIPALVFTEYVVVDPELYSTVQQPIHTDLDYIGVPAALEDDVLDIEPILWTLYFWGFAFFGLKFIRNLGQIIRRIRKNPKQKSASFIQVLLQENYPPHTFFKYIFLNKKKLESNEIPKEVLLHEETHAKQQHSWDVVFVEFLQVIFWFNPLVYLFKKAIKLNHEFLADQAVLDKDIDKATYQNTLLSYLSPSSENKYQSKMANAINYSSIKKRFTVMKKRTSKKAVLFRSLLLLPLLVILLYGFAETRIIQKETTAENVASFEQKGVSKEELAKYNSLAKKYNQQPIEVRVVPLDQLEILETLYGNMSQEQKANAQPFPECPPAQDGASRELMAEYDKLAKHYNKIPRDKMKIYKKDVERLAYIYGLMSEKQKADAEPFPDFPEPPPAPKTPKAVKAPKVKKGEKSDIPPPPPPSNLSDEAFADKVIDEVIAHQDPNDYPNGIYSKPIKGENAVLPVSSLRASGFKAKKGEVNTKWVVSSGANRDSRANNDQPPIPPVAPTIAIHANTDNYSKELKTSIRKYLDKNKDYEEAIEAYSKKGKGNRQELWDSYNEAMELYVAYYDVARKEDKFVQPMPPKAPRVLKEAVSEIPPPPAPPQPKSPLDHAIEMAKQGATFYYKKKRISSDEAISMLKKDKDLSMDISKTNDNPPVVKIDTNF